MECYSREEVPFCFFIHIPKTAGTTLRSIVDLQMGQSNVLTYYNQTNEHTLDNLNALLKDFRKSYKALIGHFDYGVHKNIDLPYTYISFIREPVEMAISSYHENLKTNRPEFRHPDGSAISLETCIRQMPNRFSNQIIRKLGGYNKVDKISEEHLHSTVEKIEKDFCFVGITEKFAESTLLLSKILGWPPCSYGSLNANIDKAVYSDEIMGNLAEINKLDSLLYRHIERQFISLVSKQGTIFKSALKELVQQNSLNFPHKNPRGEAVKFVNNDIQNIFDYFTSSNS